MEKKTMRLNGIFAAVLAAGLLTGMIWRAFVPNVVLPKLDIPAIAALSLIALLIESFTAGSKKRCWLVQLVLGAVTFALLPWAAGLECAGIRLTVCGTVVFLAITWLFDLAADRLEATVEHKAAVIPAAFVLYLACQCFMGILL